MRHTGHAMFKTTESGGNYSAILTESGRNYSTIEIKGQ